MAESRKAGSKPGSASEAISKSPVQLLEEALSGAFSVEASGATYALACSKWLGAIRFLNASRYNSTTYLSVNEDLVKEDKDYFTKLPAEKRDMLSLGNYLYRIAFSIGLVERLEKEHQELFLKKQTQKQHEQIDAHEQLQGDEQKRDISQIRAKIEAYKGKLAKKDFKAEINTVAVQPTDRLITQHYQTLAGLQQQSSTLTTEVKDARTNQYEFPRTKQALLAQIEKGKDNFKPFSFYEPEIKTPTADEKKQPATLLPQLLRDIAELRVLEQEYHQLNLQIKKLETEYTALSKKDDKNKLAFSHDLLKDLKLIAESSIEDTGKEKETNERIRNTTRAQYTGLTKVFANMTFGGPQKWDELRDVALKINQQWCRERAADLKSETTPKSIAQRVELIKFNRDQLVREEEFAESLRITTAKTRLQQLSEAKADLEKTQQAFCLRVNATLDQEIAAYKKQHSKDLEGIPKQYAKLKSQVDALQFAPKEAPKTAKKEEKETTKEKLIVKAESKSAVPLTVVDPLRVPLLGVETQTQPLSPPRAPTRQITQPLPRPRVNETKTSVQIVVEPASLPSIRRKPAPKPTRWYRALYPLGVVLAIGAAATAYLYSGPIGWIAGAAAVASFIGGGVNHKKCNTAERQRRIAASPSVTPPTSPTPTQGQGRGRAAIEMGLQAGKSLVRVNAERLGLDITKAVHPSQGEYQFVLTNGVTLSLFANGIGRFSKDGHSKDFDKFNRTPQLDAVIPERYRLRP